MELVFSQILDGLSIGSVLLLAATGLAIVFGLMGVINLAHGEFMMLGAYVTFVVQNVFRPLGGIAFELYYIVALVASFVVLRWSCFFSVLVTAASAWGFFAEPIFAYGADARYFFILLLLAAWRVVLASAVVGCGCLRKVFADH